MRVILLIITLSLSACAGNPTKKEILADKRMPVGNSSMIQMQKHLTEEEKVDKVINEYRFNDDFDQAPISEVTLNQAAPNYMSAEVPDDSAYTASVDAEEEFKAVPFDSNSYPALSDIPRKKISTNNHKKILAKKSEDMKALKKKASKDSVASRAKSSSGALTSEQASSVAPNKSEIESKLKQLQENATVEKIVAKDKIVPGSVSKSAPQLKVSTPEPSKLLEQAANSNPINSSAPVVSGVAQESKVEGNASGLPAPGTENSVAKVPASPVVTAPQIPETASSAPSLPALPSIPEPSSAPVPDVSVPQGSEAVNNAPPSLPLLPGAPTTQSMPTDKKNIKSSLPSAKPALPIENKNNEVLSLLSDSKKLPVVKDADNLAKREIGAEFKKLTSRKVKVNKDQSVEVYDSSSDQIPSLPAMPPLPK